MTTLTSGTSRTYTATVKGQLFTVTVNGGSVASITGAVTDSIGPLPTSKSLGPFNIGQQITVSVTAGEARTTTGDSDPIDMGDSFPVMALVDPSNCQLAYVGNWSGRPTTGVATGSEAIITDIPSGGRSRWYFDGTYWRTYGQLRIAGSAVALSALTGTTTKTTQATFTVPGGSMTPTGILLVEAKTTNSNSANTKLINVDFGGTQMFNTGPTTITYHGFTCKVENRGVQNSQIGCPLNLDSHIGAGVNAQQTGSVNTANDVTVNIAFTLGNTGDSMTLESWTAYIVN